MKIELDHHPEPEPRPQPAAQPLANPYRPPTASLVAAPDRAQVALWNPNAAANWCLVFSPVFGSYLHYRNWQALGDEDRARTGKVWFIVSCVILGTLPFLALVADDPERAMMVPRGIAFWYLIIWYFAAARGQARLVKERFGDGYDRRPWGMPLLIAFGATVGYILLFGLIGAGMAVAKHV
ncbi:MAG TPA: hypothetical protein VJ600_03150 [Holophagaceae bacterium]|nr:hypothetical protein [Holophagaceae bacterium]